MKSLARLIILLTIFILGCEKQEMENRLHGNWKIYAVSGTIMGWSSIRDFDIVSFNNSDKYSVFFNDTVIQGGSFKVEKQEPKQYGKINVEFLLILNESFDNHPYANFYPEKPMDIIFYGNDSLTLSQTHVSDGFNYHFVRE
jgi:hypothetical protein